jgi:hypothetical protein
LLSPELRELRDAVTAAIGARPGATAPEDEPEPEIDRADLMTMREVGELLGVGECQARNLARGDRLGVVGASGRSLPVHRVAVEVFREWRANRTPLSPV